MAISMRVEGGDYRGRRELYLRHHHDGRDLDLPYAEKTLQYVYFIWGHPVRLETVEGEQPVVLTYDGENLTKSKL